MKVISNKKKEVSSERAVKPFYFLLLVSYLFLLSSCGFHPVYGVNKYTAVGAEEKMADIEIANIPDREGQYLRNALIDRFYREGRPQNPRYHLAVIRLSESITKKDITRTSDATRGQLRMNARLVLRDAPAGREVLVRDLHTITSYNILASEFGNRVTEQNARENALGDLARQIELQLALYFKR